MRGLTRTRTSNWRGIHRPVFRCRLVPDLADVLGCELNDGALGRARCSRATVRLAYLGMSASLKIASRRHGGEAVWEGCVRVAGPDRLTAPLARLLYWPAGAASVAHLLAGAAPALSSASEELEGPAE